MTLDPAIAHLEGQPIGRIMGRLRVAGPYREWPLELMKFSGDAVERQLKRGKRPDLGPGNTIVDSTGDLMTAVRL